MPTPVTRIIQITTAEASALMACLNSGPQAKGHTVDSLKKIKRVRAFTSDIEKGAYDNPLDTSTILYVIFKPA